MQFVNIVEENLGYGAERMGVLGVKKCVYLEKQSTTTNITLLPSDHGNPLIKSINLSIHGLVCKGKGCNRPGNIAEAVLFC